MTTLSPSQDLFDVDLVKVCAAKFESLRLVPSHYRIYIWRCIRHIVWQLHGKIAVEKRLNGMCVCREIIGWVNSRLQYQVIRACSDAGLYEAQG